MLEQLPMGAASVQTASPDEPPVDPPGLVPPPGLLQPVAVHVVPEGQQKSPPQSIG
jgi:hypothetical protein